MFGTKQYAKIGRLRGTIMASTVRHVSINQGAARTSPAHDPVVQVVRDRLGSRHGRRELAGGDDGGTPLLDRLDVLALHSVEKRGTNI